MMQKNRIGFWMLGLAALAIAVGFYFTGSLSAEPHAAKAVYAEVQTWPTTAPGAVRLEGFVPFHAVYDRQYTQSSGPGAGEKRKDRVIVNADQVAWEGTSAALITLIDSGAVEHADSNARALTMVTALDDLRALFEIGPIPGKAKDYYLAQFTEDAVLINSVFTEAQELKAEKAPQGEPGFGPGAWVMASMPLDKGLKIHLAPYYSPRANPISQSSYGRVVDRKTITDGSGTEHEAWIVETSGWYGLDSPKVLQLYLKNQPPYYLGTEIYNYDTDESKKLVWLRTVQLMEP